MGSNKVTRALTSPLLTEILNFLYEFSSRLKLLRRRLPVFLWNWSLFSLTISGCRQTRNTDTTLTDQTRRAILHVAVVLMVKSAKCSWWVVNLIALCCCCHHSCLVGKTMAALAAGCRCQLSLSNSSSVCNLWPDSLVEQLLYQSGVFWEHNYFNSLFTQIRSQGTAKIPGDLHFLGVPWSVWLLSLTHAIPSWNALLFSSG